MDEGFVIIEICQNKSKQLWSNSWPDYSYGHAITNLLYYITYTLATKVSSCLHLEIMIALQFNAQGFNLI